MILSTHFVFGMAVASQTDSRLLMPALSLASHFLLDRIPHWEYLDNAKQIKNNFHLVFLDLLSPTIVSCLFFYWGWINFETLFWLNLGGFFAILPDGIVFLRYITKSKNIWLKKFFNFHRKNHTLVDLNKYWGIITQVFIIFLSVGLIFIAKNIGMG